MNIDLDVILQAGGLISVVAINYATIKANQKANHERFADFLVEFKKFDSDVWREISKLRDWRHTHQQEASEIRLGIEKDLGLMRTKMAETDGHFKSILDQLKEIKEELIRLAQTGSRSNV